MSKRRGDRSLTAAQLGGEVAPRRAWSHTAPLRFPGDMGKCAPPRILVAKGRGVGPEADSAIARALAVREQLDRYPEHEREPVIAKKWRLRSR
jgi:hypothetical protein